MACRGAVPGPAHRLKGFSCGSHWPEPGGHQPTLGLAVTLGTAVRPRCTCSEGRRLPGHLGLFAKASCKTTDTLVSLLGLHGGPLAEATPHGPFLTDRKSVV